METCASASKNSYETSERSNNRELPSSQKKPAAPPRGPPQRRPPLLPPPVFHLQTPRLSFPHPLEPPTPRARSQPHDGVQKDAEASAGCGGKQCGVSALPFCHLAAKMCQEAIHAETSRKD